MYSTVPMRIAKLGHIVLSVALIIVGVGLIARPDIFISVMGRFFGIYLILIGAVKTVGYLSKDIYRLAFQYDFVYGFILVGMGIVFLCHPDSVINLIGMLFGIVVFSDGVIKIQVARHARRFGISAWWAIFALAVISVVGGLIIAAILYKDSRIMSVMLGIIMITEGVMNIVTVITSVKVKGYRESGKKRRKDTIEVEYTIEDDESDTSSHS